MDSLATDNSISSTRPFSLWIYLLIVFGLSWPLLIASATLSPALPLRYALNAGAMVMVTVGTFISGKYVFKDGFHGAGWQWGKPKHYLWIFLLIAFLWVVPTGLGLLMGNLQLPASLSTDQVTWVFILLFVTLIPGFGEEFGWRGYMLPRLARRFNPRKAILLQAVIWWAWHLPLVIGVGVESGAAGAAQSGLPVWISIVITTTMVVFSNACSAIMHGIIFAYIWVRSQSLAAATVYHAGYDGVRDSLALTIGMGTFTGLWANAAIIILGLALWSKGDWKQLETI